MERRHVGAAVSSLESAGQGVEAQVARMAEERGALWALCYMDAHDPPEGDDATIAAEVCRQAREGGGVATRRRKAVRDGER
jgi:hypothetical protein